MIPEAGIVAAGIILTGAEIVADAGRCRELDKSCGVSCFN
jgi:hypothetical protein